MWARALVSRVIPFEFNLFYCVCVCACACFFLFFFRKAERCFTIRGPDRDFHLELVDARVQLSYSRNDVVRMLRRFVNKPSEARPPKKKSDD